MDFTESNTINKLQAETILDVSVPWTKQDIRRAYKRKAKELHPDKTNGLTTKFIELKEAHDYLMNYTNDKETNSTFCSHHSQWTSTMDELLMSIVNNYQDALIPFICSLNEEKRHWVVEFLELYGEFLLGEDVKSILNEVYKTFPTNDSVSIQETFESVDTIPVYLHELLMDQVIIQGEDYIPSWVHSWNGQEIQLIKPNEIEVDSSNTITFHIRLPLVFVFYYKESTPIPLSKSYFNGKHIIHISGELDKDELRITDEIQYPRSTLKIQIYDAKGHAIFTRHGMNNKINGCFTPNEPLDDPMNRSTCRWGIQLSHST